MKIVSDHIMTNSEDDLSYAGAWYSASWVRSALAVILIYLLIVLFFRDLVFEGKIFAKSVSGDGAVATIFGRWGRGQLARGIYPLWNPYLFSGMPSFGSFQFNPNVYPLDWLKPVYTLLFLGGSFPRILFHHLLGGIFAYMMLRELDLDPETSFLGAVVFFFTPQEVILGPAAHGGKLFTIAYLPLIFMLTRKLLRRPDFLHTGLLALVLGLQLLALHTQIAYYGLMMIALYYFIDLFQHRKQRVWKDHLLRFCALAGAGVLALGLSAYLLWPVYEYSQFSIRGGTAVGGGVAYGYATDWSFHPLESLTLLIPSWYGFGSSTYWGYMPFTDHPYYMGLIPLLLAVVALIMRRRDKVVQVLALVGVLSLLVSFGKWFPIVHKALYTVLPFFAKFRIPAMILILLVVATAALAALGLQGLLRLEGEDRQKWARRLRISALIFGIIFLVALVGKSGIGPSYVSAAASRIAPRVSGNSAIAGALAREAYGLFWADLLRIMAVAGVGSLLLHFTLRDRIAGRTAVCILALLVTVDLWAVNNRLVETVPATERAREIQSNPYSDFLNSREGTFRILNSALEVPGNYWMAMGLEDVEGYSPAKLRIYEDLRGRNAIGTRSVLAMLNTRFILYTESLPEGEFERVFSEEGIHIYEYMGALGPAWLVGEVFRAGEDTEIINALLQGLDVSRRALTTERVEPVDEAAAASGTVRLMERDIHRLRYEVEADGPVLLVMSEIYYPAGWSATVDGTAARIHRVNHVLRAVRVEPAAGTRTSVVEMTFDPISVRGGRTISLVTLLIVVTMLGAGGWRSRRSLSGALGGGQVESS